MPVDVLLVDDGSATPPPPSAASTAQRCCRTPRPRASARRCAPDSRTRASEGYAAAVYLDGDGEYDPADFERVLDPVARGRADYVIGSRFLGDRDGMTWHRTLANRVTSSLVGLLAGTVSSDAQCGYRAFSARALASAGSATTTTTPRC